MGGIRLGVPVSPARFIAAFLIYLYNSRKGPESFQGFRGESLF